jgi:hypothetical protein
MKKSTLTENKAEQTPTGGVLVGKRQGQTIIHNKGTLSGYLVGKTHAEGGIKAINKSTGQPLEMQGGEVVITAPAVSDNTKNEFNGKMMTNREILSTINEKGGGVAFAKGGDIPKNIKRTGASYKYGGKTMTDHEIYKHITGGHLAEGMTLTQIAKMHKVSVKELQKQVDMGMKAESEHTSSKREQMKIVKDHLYENPKYYSLLKKAGLKHGGRVRRGSLVRDAKSGNTPARDLNNYNDVIDMEADGMVGGNTGLFARGGKVKTYDDGGSVKEEVEYITITNGSDFPFKNIEKLRFYNFEDFITFISGLYKQQRTTDKKYIFLRINNDDDKSDFGFHISKRKNARHNFNPFTGTFTDFKNSAFSFTNFDLDKWSGLNTASKNSNKIDLSNTRIWIGNNPRLSERVQARAFELGWGNKADGIRNTDRSCMFFNEDKTFAIYNESRGDFNDYSSREIFEADLFPNLMATTTPIATPSKTSVPTSNSVKEEVEYITIGNKSDNPFDKDDNIRLGNFIDFKNWVRDLYANEGATNKRAVYLCINRDDSVDKFGVSVSQGKNTNSNFNPFTGTFKDLEKILVKYYPSSFKDFDFNRWGGVKTATTTASKTSVPTSKVLTKDELYDSKIWIGDDLDLKNKVIEKLIGIGIPEDADYGNKGYTKDLYIKIYSTDFVLWSEEKPYFEGDDRKEIFPADLGININNLGATPTATATSSGIYKASEIKLFQEIDEIIKGNDFEPLENPIVEWDDGVSTKEFVLLNDETNEIFNLRSYNLTLGVQVEDTNKDRAKGLLKIYINWKATQTTGGTSTNTIAPPIGSNNPIEVSKLTRNDLSNVKIWLGNNPELSEKIQKRAFELGLKWVDGDKSVSELDAPCLIFNGSGNTDNRIEKRASKSLFDNVNLEEIFVTDATTTSVPFDLSRTKIWIGDNPALSEKIQKRAFELGWTLFGIKDVSRTKEQSLYFDAEKNIGWFDDRAEFDNFPRFKEIFESDLFGTTSSQTSKQNASVEDEDWVKKFTADLDKLATYLPNDMDFAPELSKEQKDLNALIQLLPSFQQSKYAIERAKILKEIKKLHYKLTYEGFIKPNEATSSDADLFTPQGLLDYYFTQATQNPTAELEPACELPTPNGEKSKLPMSAYLNIRTPQFKNWFGDWEKAYENGNYVNCSKMIDPDTKEPKIYFHGVRKFVPNFGQFSNMGQGVVRPYGAFEPPTFPASYFAGEEDYAKFYGGVAENLPTPSADYKPFIYKVFLSVKNPISLLPLDFMLSYKDFMDYIYVGYGVKVEPNQELLKVLNNDITKKNPMWIYVRRDIGFIEKLKDYGYDAIFQMGDIPTFLPNGEVEPDRTKHLQEVEYLTFYPNQVKSATVKKSFYFDFFNDIRFKNGGYVRI